MPSVISARQPRTHLFFFGSRNLDETGIVVFVTRGPADDQVVSFM